MKRTTANLAKDVEELTLKFRTDNQWSDVKELAKSKNLDPMKTLLVGFLETEDELEYGVFLEETGELIEYCRSTAVKSPALKMWTKRKNIQKLACRYPGVEAGINMLRNQDKRVK
jgi:hypothetical protein